MQLEEIQKLDEIFADMVNTTFTIQHNGPGICYNDSYGCCFKNAIMAFLEREPKTNYSEAESVWLHYNFGESSETDPNFYALHGYRIGIKQMGKVTFWLPEPMDEWQEILGPAFTEICRQYPCEIATSPALYLFSNPERVID